MYLNIVNTSNNISQEQVKQKESKMTPAQENFKARVAELEKEMTAMKAIIKEYKKGQKQNPADWSYSAEITRALDLVKEINRVD